MIDLIVVRHGETDWNRIRRLQGHTDIALNAAGVAQAARLARALANEPIASIHSSDLARTVSTARPIADRLGLEIRIEPLLRERSYGMLEGKTFPEILERHPAEAELLRLRDADWPIPGGESQRAFQRRVIDVVSAIADAAEAGSTVLIVTHGGVLDMLHRDAFGIALEAERTCAIPNAVINRLTFDRGRFVVRGWAEETG